jgi:sugar transferase (PEP-CTERM/EpsH1 system associated)
VTQAVDPLKDARPLIAHVVYRLSVGGLENGVVNLINRLPAREFRHAVISMADITDFRQRIAKKDVVFIELNKGPGHAFRLYPRLYRLFRQLAPSVVHTRNLAALEATVPAFLARVPVRIHGEHGWGADDLDGSNRKFQLLRRLFRIFVTRYIALSRHLRDYLVERIGVPPGKVTQIYNGVDIERFSPAQAPRAPIQGCPFNDPHCWIAGTVGRMEGVKDHAALARAFIRVLRNNPVLAHRLRLVIIGDGPLRTEVMGILQRAGVEHHAWLPGERNDIADVLRGLDCFVLPSRAEGISNTILEAMATGLPVIVTRVGGNPELVTDGATGSLVPAGDEEALALAMQRYLEEPALASKHGAAARAEAERRFAMDSMVESYRRVYAAELARHPRNDRDFKTSNAPVDSDARSRRTSG